MRDPIVDQQDDLCKTKTFWDNYQTGGGNAKRASWWDSPIIVAECQRRISGNANMDIYQFFKKCLQGRPLEKGISICSGSGEFERTLMDNGLCRQIDAYELSVKRVEEGRTMAEKGGYNIRFYREDVNQAVFRPDYYDIFFSWSALHHIENLEGVIYNARRCLKKKGVLVAQEYIGPNRFQWTHKQLEILNRVLKCLPVRLRKDPKTGNVKKRIDRPTINHMKDTDPSEAIRSNEIIPALQKHFNIIILKYFGGAIFHPLFDHIMSNFDPENDTEAALIRMILLLERVMTEEKILKDNYAIIVAERK
ncbi:MAG: class I SAM-dependent methyltransferase [Deltaproteobacteria bacterium]|nr:class I SAM-dependent methyltransferase [Deltaproteobacteria bacterium]